MDNPQGLSQCFGKLDFTHPSVKLVKKPPLFLLCIVKYIRWKMEEKKSKTNLFCNRVLGLYFDDNG